MSMGPCIKDVSIEGRGFGQMRTPVDRGVMDLAGRPELELFLLFQHVG